MSETIDRLAREMMKAEPWSSFWSEDDARKLVRAVVVALREPTVEIVTYGAKALDHPSVYMGGPSAGSVRYATRAWSTMIDAVLRDAPNG